MTKFSNGTIATDLDNNTDNEILASQGYTIRHIETYHRLNQSYIIWDQPSIAEADLPF